MTDSLWTMEEAQTLLEDLVGRPGVSMMTFDYGWVAVPTLTEDERARGQALGQGTFVIDREARVITAHGSLGTPLIAKRYAEARRQGRITGRKIWPTED